ncbi:hypothetical protein D3C75_772870 [compost metagenome]
MKFPERPDRLPENLDGWHSLHILDRGSIDIFQRVKIFLQSLLRFLPRHHGVLGRKADDHRDRASQCEPYVQGEHNDDNRHDHHGGTDQIGQLMGDEQLDFLDILLDILLHFTARVLVEIAERQLGDMLGQLHPDAVQDAEGRDVRQHPPHVHEEVAKQHADSSPNRPAYHIRPVYLRNIRCMAQQLAHHHVHRCVRYKHHHDTDRRQDAGPEQERFFLTG